MITREQLKAWRNGAEGFLQWVEDVKPCVPTSRGKFEPFVPEQFQRDFVTRALATDSNGDFKHGTIVFSFPRRHSKTTLAALLCLWRFTTRQGENILALANSRTQTASVSFGLARRIVLNSSALRELIGVDNILTEKMLLPMFNNVFRGVPCNESSLYGEKITCGWCSELHAAQSDEAMQILGSSLGDSENAWLLVDSTVDGVGGPLHKLQTLAETGEDPTVFFGLLQYRDLAEGMEKSPPWIRRPWLESRNKQLLPATFSTQHLNQRSEASNSLFAAADISACKARLPMPMNIQTLRAYAQGRSFVCGGGLDRAYAFSLNGDKTIWTSVAKLAPVPEQDGGTGGEAVYLVLNQKDIFGSLASGIKKAITQDYKEFSLHNVCIEAYNAQDIGIWSTEQGMPCEIIHATNTAQQPAFLELHRIVKEGRLLFSDELDGLAQEMGTFLYELRKGTPHFGSDKFHDDRVYSLSWAVHSLRHKELAAYELKGIVCNSQSKHACLCYLRDGDAILHCSQTCATHAKVLMMYRQYRSTKVESDLTLPQFYNRLVKVSGVRIVR